MNEEHKLPEQISDSNNNDCKRYDAALSLLFYEGEIAWQMNLLFIGLNVGIGTIIGNSLLDVNNHKVLLAIFSLIGLIINSAWLGTFRRNNKYYHFRMAQAREAEPKEWKLLRNRGYKFSKGHEIVINGKGLEKNDNVHQLNSFEKRASNKLAIECAIWMFILCFLFLLILCIYYIFNSICNFC